MVPLMIVMNLPCAFLMQKEISSFPCLTGVSLISVMSLAMITSLLKECRCSKRMGKYAFLNEPGEMANPFICGYAGSFEDELARAKRMGNCCT